MTSVSSPLRHRARSAASWLILAWITALVATLSAVFIGEVLGRTPCVLCWYQRIFMFPLVLVLGVACYRGDCGIWRYALPLGVVGAAFASYHTLLYWRVIEPEIVACSAEASCSGAAMAIFGYVPLPLLSLTAFAVIVLSLLFVRHHTK
ncbi:disulfide bond formation protein B [Achromobacter seleniivolatilans]|uniref:Disulfide bond formation protein B n=1 Tax=Achromobacter seleniivolatilans TaxID=3047478 RepID=A0ABY9LY41_9BURK|nr:disulfide bond formation protein B [Achromobacter sp. R39]WMD19704.1 disulfide bond formation protein B [Achromobacter sp. R39]